MKKEIAIHLFSYLLIFLFVTLLRRYTDPRFALLWIGGLIGTILPDIDHLIYVYLLQPHELTSQRVNASINNGKVSSAFELMAATSDERRQLIFHTAWFQILFFVIAYWVISSSSILLAKGIVIAFCLHLIVDQIVDLSTKGNLDNWFNNLQIKLSREKATFYVLIAFFVLLLLLLLI